MNTDPVCGMELEGCDFNLKHKGEDYCFCSSECRDQFKKSPGDFI
ncbi:MAG: YHS domain-containing protein [Thermodesulfobacteriota bacterium]